MIAKPAIDRFKHTTVNVWKPPTYLGRSVWPIRALVFHISQGTYAGSINWANNPEAEASFHYIVAFDGRIGEVVDPFGPYAPWANGVDVGHTSLPPNLIDLADGSPNANWVTVSIEFEGKFDRPPYPTEAQYESSSRLAAWLCSKTGLEPKLDRTFVPHKFFSTQDRPNCPGPRLSLMKITDLTLALLQQDADEDARLEEVYQQDPAGHGAKLYSAQLRRDWYTGKVLRTTSSLLTPDGRDLSDSNVGNILDDWEQDQEEKGTLQRYV